MWRWILAGIVGAVGFSLIATLPLYALEVPKAPSLETPIVDQTGTLKPEQIRALADQIAASRKEKSYQIGILIIPTLGIHEYLEGYSLKVARGWGIGDKTDNGVLLLVVKNDRELRIEVGRGLEGDLTDARSSQIIRNVITPKFRAGQYYEGISEGVDSIQLAVEKRADPKAEDKGMDAMDWGSLVATLAFMGLGLLSWLGAVLARSKSWWAGGVVGGVAGVIGAFLIGWSVFTGIGVVVLVGLGLLFDFLVSRNFKSHMARGDNASWWAGGGHWGSGGGFSGGGGGSFGGGGFSGGGSSGSW